MAPRVAIIADDLTGALDAAAPFAARGLATRVAVTGGDLDAALAHKPAVVAVNTATRHADAGTAAAQAGACAERLAALRPALLFKKIDSTLRGPVGAELAEILGIVEWRALLCPAVPDQGRSVRAGRLLLDGRPLRETAAAQDGRSIVAEDDLTALLGPALGDVRAVAQGATWPDSGHLVVDAETGADLAAIAKRVLSKEGPWLAAGAAGLSEALAEAAFGPRQPVGAPPPVPPALFILGSRNARTQAQVAALDARGVFRADAAVELPLPAGDLVLTVPHGNGAAGGCRDPDAVAAELAARARQLLPEMQPGLLVVTGGDTAQALLNALHVTALEVLDEVRPGIVRARLAVDGRDVTLIGKAGGFGSDTLFAELADWCRAA